MNNYATDSSDIAFLVPEDRQSGTYFRFLNLAIGLKQLGHTVTIYSQTNESRTKTRYEEREGIQFVLRPTVPGNRWMMSPVHPVNIVRRLLSKVHKADVYHLFQPFPSSGLHWLSLARRRSGIFAYDWDDHWINDHNGYIQPKGLNNRMASFWIRNLEKRYPVKCDLLTTLSQKIEDLANTFCSPNTELIYNGIWDEKRKNKAESRARLKLDPNAVYLGMMGWSGIQSWVFKSLRSLKETYPNIRIAWCGQEPSDDLKNYPDIADRIDALGFLPSDQLDDFRYSIDLGLLPMGTGAFDHYRLPIKLTDFLSAGVPVIASNVGETATVAGIVDGIHHCEPNFDSWNTKLHSIAEGLANDTFNRRPNNTKLKQHFHWLDISRKLAGAYQRALVKKRTGSPK